MSITSDNKYTGGLTFNSPAFQLGAMNGAAINGGLSFDLPLATVAAFNQQALDFTTTGASNRYGFLQNVIGSSGAGVRAAETASSGFFTRVADAVVAINNQSTNVLQGINTQAVQAASGSGGGGGWCFITTAVCEFQGLNDDCDTLQILRKFRDEFMLTNENGKTLVEQYYREAPAIVNAIDRKENVDAIYQLMLDVYINPCVTLITSGHYDAAFILYVALFDFAQKAGA